MRHVHLQHGDHMIVLWPHTCIAVTSLHPTPTQRHVRSVAGIKMNPTYHHGSFNATLEHASPVCLSGILGMRGGKCDQLQRQFLLNGVQLVIEHWVHVHRLLVDHSTNRLHSNNHNTQRTIDYMWSKTYRSQLNIVQKAKQQKCNKKLNKQACSVQMVLVRSSGGSQKWSTAYNIDES